MSRLLLAALTAAWLASASLATGQNEPAPAPPNENWRLEGVTYGWTLAGRAAQNAQCREEWRFGAKGALTVVSGEEIVEKAYALGIVTGDSMMRLVTTRLSTNGKPDCMGVVSNAIGQTRETYIQFLNDGSFFTCGSTDGLSCYGLAAARPLSSNEHAASATSNESQRAPAQRR